MLKPLFYLEALCVHNMSDPINLEGRKETRDNLQQGLYRVKGVVKKGVVENVMYCMGVVRSAAIVSMARHACKLRIVNPGSKFMGRQYARCILPRRFLICLLCHFVFMLNNFPHVAEFVLEFFQFLLRILYVLDFIFFACHHDL